MSALWMRLTGSSGEARSLIGRNLVGKVDTLIGNAENRLWRARVGSEFVILSCLLFDPFVSFIRSFVISHILVPLNRKHATSKSLVIYLSLTSSASGALAEILVGRSWKDLGGGESSSYSDAE